jgi:hypothetical protein
MKGHKAHHHEHRGHHAKGGMIESGVKEYEQDLKDKPEEYNHGKPEKEAEERKHGGRTKRKHGGHVHHADHEHHEHHAHGGKAKKHVGHVEGEHAKHRGDRKPRKSGGRAGSNMNPLSSAAHGTAPKNSKMEMIS